MDKLSDPLFYVVAASVIVVGIILAVGIGGFTRGGDFNRKYANKIMRMRIVAQFIAVLIILAYVIYRGLD